MIQKVNMYQYICDRCEALAYFFDADEAEDEGWEEVNSDGNDEIWCDACNMETIIGVC